MVVAGCNPAPFGATWCKSTRADRLTRNDNVTKKKQRGRLARALRAQGLKGVRAFAVAKAVIRAGCPAALSASTAEQLGLTILPGYFCEIRFKHRNTEVFCPLTGACVVSAWQALWSEAY